MMELMEGLCVRMARVRLAILEFEFTPKPEQAGFTGRDVSTRSSAAKAIHVRVQGDQGLADTMMELKEDLCGIAITKA